MNDISASIQLITDYRHNKAEIEKRNKELNRVIIHHCRKSASHREMQREARIELESNIWDTEKELEEVRNALNKLRQEQETIKAKISTLTDIEFRVKNELADMKFRHAKRIY